MADDRELEPTEPASQRRLEQARARGQVARSPEFSSFTVLLAAVGALILLTPSLSEQLLNLFSQAIIFDRTAVFSSSAVPSRLTAFSVAALLASLPVLLVLFLTTFFVPVLIGGWLFAPQGMVPDLTRADPLLGLRRLFSLPTAFGFLQTVIKVGLLAAALFTLLWLNAEALVDLRGNSAVASAAALARWLGWSLLSLAGVVSMVALGDALFRTWYYRRGLRMTRAEVSQEYREAEGDPAVKSRVRARQRLLLSARGIGQDHKPT